MKKLLTFLLILTAFTASAQVYQRDPSYGRSIDRYEVLKALHIPTVSGVPDLSDDVITNTSAIAYDSTGHKFYVYDPSTETWGQVTGGGVIIDPGVDSITYHNNQLCQWVSGVSTCYFLNKFYDSTALNHDSTRVLHFNSGNLVDSVLIPTGTIHIIQDGAGETNIVRVEDSTRLHFPTLKNTDDITPVKNSDSSVSFNFTHPHYTKSQVDSIAAGITAGAIDTTSISNRINTKIDSIKRSYDSVFFKINGSWFFAFKDGFTPALTVLTDGATITWNYLTDSREAKVTLAGNRTLSITNLPTGKVVYLTLGVTQDATGSRTLTLPAGTKVINGGSGAVTLTTTASATDILSFRWNGTTLFCTYGKNYN